MKTLLAFVLVLVGNPALAEFKLRFSYSPYEGEGALSCTHEKLPNIPDWKIDCEGKKKYIAHFVVEQRHRADEPRTYLEVLYSIIDQNGPSVDPVSLYSSSSWMFTNEKASLNSLAISQGVEGGLSRLMIEVSFPTPDRNAESPSTNAGVTAFCRRHRCR